VGGDWLARGVPAGLLSAHGIEAGQRTRAY